MGFDIWYKWGTAPYKTSTLQDLFTPQNNTPIILCESQQEKEILQGLSVVFGSEIDIRVIEPSSSVNPWSYNRGYLYYTFNPLERFQ